jgi:hypothetical protein
MHISKLSPKLIYHFAAIAPQMSSKKESPSNDEGTTTARAAEKRDIADVVRDNTLRIVDEMAKAQPQFSQSMSNL